MTQYNEKQVVKFICAPAEQIAFKQHAEMPQYFSLPLDVIDLFQGNMPSVPINCCKRGKKEILTFRESACFSKVLIGNLTLLQ
jgi:hypothetical protein